MVVAEKEAKQQETVATVAVTRETGVAPDVLERSVVLREVAWEIYQTLRSEEDNNHLKMTYDQGVLEVMSPSRKHERVAGVIGWMICEWALARRIKIALGGRTTLSRAAVERGLEADDCYWISHSAAISDKSEVDLNVDPPPDLAIEVDISRAVIPKLPLYESLRVPEVWRWHKGKFTVLVLGSSGKYSEQSESTALPGFPFTLAQDLLDRRKYEDDTELMMEFRQAISPSA